MQLKLSPGLSLEGFTSLQPSTADACFYISQNPFYPYSRSPKDGEPHAESKGHEYCARHHLELAFLSSEEDMEVFMIPVINRKYKLNFKLY